MSGSRAITEPKTILGYYVYLIFYRPGQFLFSRISLPGSAKQKGSGRSSTNHGTFTSQGRKDGVETRAFNALCGPARATSSRVFLGKSLHLSGWTIPKRLLNCEKGTDMLYLAFSIEGPLGSLHVDQIRSFLAKTAYRSASGLHLPAEFSHLPAWGT